MSATFMLIWSCVAQVKEAVLTRDFIYETGPGRPYKPVVRNVRLENARSTNSPRVMWITSFPGAVIDHGRLAICAGLV
jgi:hypothetical protein